MSACIVCVSKYGATRKCAEMIAERLSAGTTILDLGARRAVCLDRCDTVVIGGPIYGGTIHRRMVSFCRRNRKALLQKRVALFISCAYQGERAEEQLLHAYPDWLYVHAFARRALGGELHMDKLKGLDRLLVARLTASQDTTFEEGVLRQGASQQGPFKEGAFKEGSFTEGAPRIDVEALERLAEAVQDLHAGSG